MSSKELQAQLAPDKPLHRKVSDALKARLRMSDQASSDRREQMGKNEELFQAYIPESDVDALRRRSREVSGVPHYRTVEIPYAYAVLLTAHTYYTSVFLSRNPVLQLAGRHGEAENKRLAIEALLSYQTQVGRMLLNMFVWLLDPGKYGYGVVGHHWDQELIRVRQRVKKPRSFMGLPIPGTEREVDEVSDVPGYIGNRAYNVRPQDWFNDPRYPIIHFQKGEFCGRYTEISWAEIYEGQRSGRFFNYSALKKMRDRDEQQTSPTRDTGSANVTTLPDEPDIEAGYDVPSGHVKGHEIYIRLVPDDWKLAKGDRYEIWAFNIAANGTIFGAEPTGEYSNEFPFDVLVDEIDGYSIAPKAMLERCKPMNDVITWLINSHFYNVRQTLNNQFVVDPSMLVMKDVENPNPGKIIRVKPAAYGRDVRTMLQQLQVVDVTRTHLADVGLWQDVIQRITGVNDTVMGMVNPGSRRTATEVRQSTSFGINRLKTQCEWYSTIGFAPFTQKLVQRTQQFYDVERQFRIVGDQAQFSPNFAMVTPADILGFYDYEPVDGTLPVDRFAQANLWQMLMGQIKDVPQVMMQYDIAKIFAWVASLAGIKNMAQFRLMPDQAVQQQVAAGNVVPIQTAMKEANLNEPGQVPGMGATG